MNAPSLFINTSVQDNIARVILNKPPHNFLDFELVKELADVLDGLSASPDCRVIVLSSAAKSFCAGADFSGSVEGSSASDPAPFYAQAMRLFSCTKPIVGVIGGAAIGAGLGLAVVCDFRLASPAARFSANFCRLGFHPGFGLSLTLPQLIGQQHAARLFYTGARVDGHEAHRIGLVDDVVDDEKLYATAEALAGDIAASSPLAVQSTRATLRGALFDEVSRANQKELELQRVQFRTSDFREGVAAMAARRLPKFVGN